MRNATGRRDRDEPPAASAQSWQNYAGRHAWLITDGKAGMDAQVVGVAKALRLRYEMKHVAPPPPFGFLAPFGPVAPAEKFGQPNAPQFAPDWPEIALATGRQSIPYLRALRKKAGAATFTVILQDPRTGLGSADLIWVPAHDRLRGKNVVTTLTAPHKFTPQRLARLRETTPVDIAVLPHPRIAVMLGGPNRVYAYKPDDIERLKAAIASLAQLEAGFMISVSRRTPEALLQAVLSVTRERPRVVYSGAGHNPYGTFLAHADWLVVTADSVNMCGEACATGRPVFGFEPSGGSAKFSRFLQGLKDYGAVKELPARIERLDPWTYQPLDSATQIAIEIATRWKPPRRSKHVTAGMTHVIEDS